MGRNYSKESEWRKQKYERIYACIDKDLGLQLKEKIKNDSKYESISEWIAEQAEEYLKDKE